MKRYFLFLIIFFVPIVAATQPAKSRVLKIQHTDLRIDSKSMATYLEEQFIKNRNVLLQAEGVRGLFWIKLVFNKKWVLERFDISTGTTTPIYKFLSSELRKLVVTNISSFQSSSEFTYIVIPVRFWLYMIGSSETKQIAHDNADLLDFFSAPENQNRNFIFLSEIWLGSPIE